MIATISPEAQHTDESISTCHFAQRVALVKNSASINAAEVEPALVIERLKAEVRRLREEVEFLSGKNDDDSSCDGDDERDGTAVSQGQLIELTESIQIYVQDRDNSSQLDFCGGITLPKIRAVCSIFKTMLLESKEKAKNIDDDRGSNSSSDDESADNDEERRAPLPLGGTNGRGSKKGNMHQVAQSHHRSSDDQSPAKSSKVESVCGVPICSDKQVIDEPNLAFAWFKDHHQSLATIEKTKNSLKMKYTEAKHAGKSIEEIRSRISHHKEKIAKLRKRYAISLVSGHDEEKMNESDFAYQEKFHTDAIEQEKATYKDTLERLRVLKASIETTQKSMKEDRLKLQGDFDKWYHQVCHEESRRTRSTLVSENKISAQIASEPSSRLSKSNTKHDNDIKASVQRAREDTNKCDAETKQPPPTDTEAPKEFKLPPGIILTGNTEADEDIIAFYKAKEILLSRTKR